MWRRRVLFAGNPGPFGLQPALHCHSETPALDSRTGSRFGDGLDHGVPAAATNDKVAIRLGRVVCRLSQGTATGLLRRARRLRGFYFAYGTVPVLAPPSSFRSPQKSSFWSGEPRPLASGCPRQMGRTGETFVPQQNRSYRFLRQRCREEGQQRNERRDLLAGHSAHLGHHRGLYAVAGRDSSSGMGTTNATSIRECLTGLHRQRQGGPVMRMATPWIDHWRSNARC